ncbi:hypothetical protein [Novipirellula caenicola]|uniref:Myosin heavy chain n=1 Tax=Novipirellula caenicola TaxID=1536901 RepID=A0ABP9W113_9BACT
MTVKLRSVRWRHAIYAAIRALSVGWCVLLSLMMLSMALDWLFPFMNPPVRLLMTSSTLIATVIMVIVMGINPIRRSLGWHHAASCVDVGVPQLEERWSTVASLSTRDQSADSATAKAMAAQVTSEAIAMERIVRPDAIASPVPLRRTIVAAAIMGIILVGMIAASPEQISILLQRFWNPTTNITATQLTNVTGDLRVPRGDTINLVTKLSGVSRSMAMLTLRDDEGHEQTHRLRPDDEIADQFSHPLRVDQSLSYRIRSGDAQTDWNHVQAIDYPEIAELQFSIEFPEYTDRPSVHRDLLPRRIKVVQGSYLTLAIKPLESPQRLSISIAAPKQSVRDVESDQTSQNETVQDLVPDADGWYQFRMQLIDDVVIRPMLESRDGLTNQRKTFCRIDVIEDKAPVARVISPTDEMAVAVDETIEIEFEAHDDHGIATAELVIYDETQKDAEGNPKVVAVKEIPLGDQKMQKHVMWKTQLDLKELNLPEGSEISYAVRVSDNRNVPAAEPSTPDSPSPPDPSSPPAPNTGDQDGTRIAAIPKQTADDPATKSNATSLKANEEGLARQDSDDTDRMPTLADSTAKQSEKPQTVPNETDKDPAAVANPSRSDAYQSASDPASKQNPKAKEPASSDKQIAKKSEDDKARGDASETNSPQMTADDPRDQTAKNRDGSSTAKTAGKNDSVEKDKSNRDVANKDNVVTEEAAQKRDSDPSNAMPEPNKRDDAASPAASSLENVTAKPSPSNTPPPPPAKYSLEPQRSRSGQNTMTGRRRLKITARLAAIAEANDLPGEEMEVRDNVVAIDKMLAEVETGLKQLLDHRIADADRAEQFRRLDVGLGNIEAYVADLREQTKQNQYAFVGLQMVDIARTHVTPARDRVFAAIQRPNASDADATVSLQHVVRARELLDALLKRYDRVVQEKKLKRSLDETVTMYEIYIEKRRTLMRESRQNRNPLERKMGIIEVDQEYLDRFAEVVKLRREMMDEFAQMLGDDPRLLSRYLELVKRRRNSLRDRLTDISQRQYDATEEVLGWLQIDESQKPDLWTIIVELRLHSATELAKDAAELAERIEKQMPLELDAAVGTPADVIRQAKQIASLARTISFDADKVIAAAGAVEEKSSLVDHARTLVAQFDRFSATLDRLLFENEAVDAITDYVEPRMLETRTVADQADAWAILSQSLAEQSFSRIVKTEQHRIAVETQMLRVEMLDMKTELDGQFQQFAESSVPNEIAVMIEQLHRLMETITFNQAAAAFRAGQTQLDSAARQQQLATERLIDAEQLFDKIRHAVVDALDQYDMQNPNIADLRDPTLDEFLARLEREPNIAAQLGIPNRPRNLRVIADSVFWQQSGAGALGESGQAAAARSKEAMKMKRASKNAKKDKPEPQKLSDEQREKREEAKKAQQMLEKSLVEIQEQRDDPKTTEAQRRRLEQLAEDVQKMIDLSDDDNGDRAAWERIVQSDEAATLLQAISAGKAIPDQQWNKLLSTLDDGLWQVRGKQPPAAYRKAIEQYQDQIRELMQTIDED